MPRGDKTGPSGAGPMTGRLAGYCAGYSVPGYMNPRFGYGRGWGRAFCRGRGRGWYAYPPPYLRAVRPPTPEQEVIDLKNYHKNLVAEKVDLEKEINNIKARIEDLKAKVENNNHDNKNPRHK